MLINSWVRSKRAWLVAVAAGLLSVTFDGVNGAPPQTVKEPTPSKTPAAAPEKKDKKVRGGTIVDIDTNRWKTFLANRWRSGSPRPANDPTYRPNEPGALYLWGTDANTHATFGSHQLSEYGDRQIHGRTGRSLEVWRLRPGADNERFDCMVGCCVLADYAGGISLKDAGLKKIFVGDVE